MDCINYTTETRKVQHLSLEERVIIQTRLKDGWNTNKIANELGRSYNCIKTEIRRGMTPLYNGKVMRYKARTGQMVYELNRSNCVRNKSIMNCMRFIRYVEQKFEEEHWSLDVNLSILLDTFYSNSFKQQGLSCHSRELS